MKKVLAHYIAAENIRSIKQDEMIQFWVLEGDEIICEYYPFHILEPTKRRLEIKDFIKSWPTINLKEFLI